MKMTDIGYACQRHNFRGPRFALEGIGGLYNYGCEAIVRGTLAVLRNQWPDCSVTYISMRYNDDRIILRDAEITVLPSMPTLPLTKRAFNAAMRRLHLPFRWQVSVSSHWLDHVDCVLSIGGDIYTLWHGEETASHFHRVEKAHEILDRGIPMVLWGASVGPFEANPHAIKAFAGILNRMPLITVRESLTLHYLNSLGIRDHVKLVADPAYLMSVDHPDATANELYLPTTPTVAVNFSPLSVSYANGSDAAHVLNNQACAVAQIIELYDIDVLLVPHVVCPWRPEDDDYGYLLKIQKLVPSKTQPRIRVLPPGLGAQRTKQIIAQCQLVVAARMHCCVAGISTQVPTLLLSYSPKAIGMAEYVYGNRDWVLPVTCKADCLVSTVGALLSQTNKLRLHLQQRLVAITADALMAGAYLNQTLSL